MEECKNVCTPAETKLVLDNGKESYQWSHREVIGSLLFLSSVSRPDITFIVNYLSRFLTRYDKVHCCAAKRVLRYLKQTPNSGIEYCRNSEFVL